MSYRPDSQSLEGPCLKIIEGIDEFSEAATERIKSGDWKAEHETELVELQQRMTKLRLDLYRLERETW